MLTDTFLSIYVAIHEEIFPPSIPISQIAIAHHPSPSILELGTATSKTCATWRQGRAGQGMGLIYFETELKGISSIFRGRTFSIFGEERVLESSKEF